MKTTIEAVKENYSEMSEIEKKYYLRGMIQAHILGTVGSVSFDDIKKYLHQAVSESISNNEIASQLNSLIWTREIELCFDNGLKFIS